MTCAYGAVAILVLSQPAWAQPLSLRDVLFGAHAQEAGRPSPPSVGRYVDEDGDTAFILDRSSPTVLLRFEASPEIWLLSSQPGPRGDVLYKNDMGEPMLRATKLGGMTLFTGAHPGGAAASLVGETQAIRAAAILSPAALLQRLAQASARASRALQRLVVFDASDVTPQSATLIADAAGLAAEAITVVVQRPDGRRILTRLSKVTLTPGRKPSAGLNNGVLQIVVTPPRDGASVHDLVAGRPSSHRIEAAFIH